MKPAQKILMISFLLMAGASPAAAQYPEDRISTHTQTRYQIRDELFSSYSTADLRELARRLKNKTDSFKENAGKKFNNLLPMQGKSRLMVGKAKEQSARLKEQQALRNRIQQDQVNGLREKRQALAKQRADLRLKIRMDR